MLCLIPQITSYDALVQRIRDIGRAPHVFQKLYQVLKTCISSGGAFLYPETMNCFLLVFPQNYFFYPVEALT